MKKALLVLGGGQDQVFMLKTCKEMGYISVCVDGNPNSPGLKIADYSKPINFSKLKPNPPSQKMKPIKAYATVLMGWNKNTFINIENSKGYIDFKKIIVGSSPVLIIGFVYHDFIDQNLRNIEIIAFTTILFAIPLIFIELFKKGEKDISEVNYFDIFIIGIFQAFALAPGASRSAVIILAALLLGYNKKCAIIISVVLSFPVILLAMAYKVYTANEIFVNLINFLYIVSAIIISFCTSYLVIKYFIIYINKIGFIPFMIYRIFLGVILLFFFI